MFCPHVCLYLCSSMSQTTERLHTSIHEKKRMLRDTIASAEVCVSVSVCVHMCVCARVCVCACVHVFTLTIYILMHGLEFGKKIQQLGSACSTNRVQDDTPRQKPV